MNPRFHVPRPTRLVILRVCTTLLAASFYVFNAGCGGPEKEKEPVATVEAASPQRTAISQVISADAIIFPVQQSVITPKISSTIKEFLVQRGSKVRKGQLLAVLENADLAAAAEQSKGEFDQAEASYATTIGAGVPQQMQKAELDAVSAKAGYEAAQKVYDSRKELFQQGALPRRDLDAAAVALAQAKSQSEVAERQLQDLQRLGKQQALKSAEGQLSAAKGKFMGSKAQLSYSEIRSPIDGVVTERPQYPGELAAANQPLMTLMDTSRLIAKAHISRSETVALKLGDSTEVRAPESGDLIHGRVSLISPALDPGSTTIEVWIEIAKPSPALKPGMTVPISIVAKTEKDALVIPASALFKNADNGDYVMVAGSDEHAHNKIVKVGVRNGADVQIIDGLNATDKVISAGGYGLPDNSQIKVQQAAPAKVSGDEKANGPGDPAKPETPDKE
jgi:HlyD family secretion protein